MNSYSILYNGNVEMDIKMFNSVLQSVITYADYIWMNSNVVLSQNIPNLKNAEDIIKTLEEKKIIRRWAYPFLEKGGEEQILPFEDYKEINQKINEIFLSEEELLPTVSFTYKPMSKKFVGKGVETTSKIISIRKEYWAIAIANILHADRLLIAPEYKNLWLHASEKLKYPLVEKKIIEYTLDNICSLPNLSILRPDEIIELYNKNKHFKRKLCEISQKVITEFQYVSDITHLAKEIEQATWDFIDEVSNRKIMDILKDIVYGIGSIFYPAIAALPFVDKFLEWLSTKRQYGYILFLSEVRKISKKYKAKGGW